MFITSFSPSGFDLYGDKFLRSFLEHSEEKITVYFENIKPLIDDERIIYKNLFDVPGCLQFLETTHHLPIFRGEVNGKKTYKLDIFKFSRKCFAQIDSSEEEKLYWLDADMEITSKPG